MTILAKGTSTVLILGVINEEYRCISFFLCAILIELRPYASWYYDLSCMLEFHLQIY